MSIKTSQKVVISSNLELILFIGWGYDNLKIREFLELIVQFLIYINITKLS